MVAAAFLQLSGPATRPMLVSPVAPALSPPACALAGATRGDGRYMAFGEAHGLLKLVCSRHARGGSSRGRLGMARAGRWF
jgi:hypothetical protein